MSVDPFAALRQAMVAEIEAEAALVGDQTGRPAFSDAVMRVVGEVPRHEFVPAELRELAYVNSPLPIGFGKTISQPFIVALMTDLLELGERDSVLEIGTGLGYQAAILSRLGRRVYSVELLEELAVQARTRLARGGYRNITLHQGNGYHGWSAHAPYEKVIVTAAPDLIPPGLIRQVKPGGRMVIPAGIPDAQQLMLVEKSADGRVTTTEILRVRFSQLEPDEPGEAPADRGRLA
jgi:protein-L-isoaspartate(D-aspartate) O-methyltransferase